MKSICIVRLSALGDVLMLVPLVRTLQAHYPKVALTWIISKPAYYLVEGMAGIEFVIIEKPEHVLDYWQFYKRLQKRRFDVLIAAQASFRANLLYPFIRAKRKIGFDPLRAKDGHRWFVRETITPGNDHTLESFLKFADVLGIQSKCIIWDMPLSDNDRAWAKATLSERDSPVVVVNPAASKEERNWPVERYIEIIRHMQKRWHAFIVLTGGPGPKDRVLGEAIATCVPVLNLIGKTKPKQLLALIAQANLMICPDTGPSHMAASVGTPVIALHAVTSAEVSGPYPFRHLAVDCYPQAVEKVLKTTMEKNVWGTHAHGMDTMRLITTEQVVARLEQVFQNFSSST